MDSRRNLIAKQIFILLILSIFSVRQSIGQDSTSKTPLFVSVAVDAFHISTRTIPLLLKDATMFSEVWPLMVEILHKGQTDIGGELETGGYLFNFYDIQFPGVFKVRSIYLAPALKLVGGRGWFNNLKSGEGFIAKFSIPLLFYSSKIEEDDGSVRQVRNERSAYLAPGLGFQKVFFKRLVVAGLIEYQRPISANAFGLFYSHHFRPSVWVGIKL